LADRIGRRPVVLGSVVTFGLFTLLTPFTSSIQELSAARFIAGCALGGIKPVIYALNIESAPRSMRSSVVAIVYVGFSLGQALSGAVAGLVIADWGWQAIFIVGGVAPLIVAVALVGALPESLRFMAARPTLRARLAAQVGFVMQDSFIASSTTFTLGDEPSSPTGSKRRFATRQLFAGPLKLITPLIYAAEICAIFVTHFFYNWTPTLMKMQGASTRTASFGMSVYAIGAMLGPLVFTRLIDRHGPHWSYVAPCLATVFLASGAVLPFGGVGALPIAFVIGFLVMGVQMSLGSLFMQCYPTAIRANATGLFILVGGIGSVSSPIVTGRLFESGLSAQEVLLWITVPMACLVPLSWALSRQYAAVMLPRVPVDDPDRLIA
ncbi:MAG: MFS transporter, partial [Steroidobacteraceae bacterium]